MGQKQAQTFYGRGKGGSEEVTRLKFYPFKYLSNLLL